MKVHLPDTAREAFQFLLLAIGLLLVLRLAYAGLALWKAPPVTTDLALAIDQLRDGYLLSDRLSWPVGGVDLPGRLAVAVLVALGGGITSALLGTGVDRMLGRAGWKSAVLWARIGLVLCGGLGVYSALFVPPVEAAVTEAGIVLRERPRLLGTLGLPFSGDQTLVPMKGVPDPAVREEGGHHVVYITGRLEHKIACTTNKEAATELARGIRQPPGEVRN